jgi:predicted SAM-dependent methyltransferase
MTLKQKIGKALPEWTGLSRRTIDIIRFEIGCASQRLRNALSPAYHRKIAALHDRCGLSVNFGSGGRGLPGWINIDVRANQKDQYVALDLRRKLPFRDGSVKRILAEHVIEHLDFRDDVPGVFREFHRILSPDGTVRIIVPDAARYMAAYVAKSTDNFRALGWDLENLPSDIYTPVHIVNHVFHQGGEHYFGWDFETMDWALRGAGFREVLRQSYHVSRDKELAIDQPNHAPYSLYVEAVKKRSDQ